jgi:hypothetical protein
VNPVERRISVFEPFKLLLLFVISSGPGPIGGVIFTAGLLLFARKFNGQVTKNCLLISALGVLFFFVVNQDLPLVENLNPPFGLLPNHL